MYCPFQIQSLRQNYMNITPFRFSHPDRILNSFNTYQTFQIQPSRDNYIILSMCTNPISRTHHAGELNEYYIYIDWWTSSMQCDSLIMLILWLEQMKSSRN
ncbi:hypothetical protein BsWGS_08186 [Bradybaena similaris]